MSERSAGRLSRSSEADSCAIVSMCANVSPIASRSRASPPANRPRSWTSCSICVCRLGDQPHGRAEVADDRVDQLVPLGERGGEGGRPRDELAHRHSLALEGADDVGREGVDGSRVERLEQRLEAVEQHVEVERRVGAVDADRSARPAGPPRRARCRRARRSGCRRGRGSGSRPGCPGSAGRRRSTSKVTEARLSGVSSTPVTRPTRMPPTITSAPSPQPAGRGELRGVGPGRPGRAQRMDRRGDRDHDRDRQQREQRRP